MTVALALFLLVTTPPDVFGDGSHSVFVDRIHHGSDLEYRRAVAAYDAHLEAHRDDGVAALERCKLIDEFADVEEPLFENVEKDAAACRITLRAMKATPEIELYFVERDWGDTTAPEALLTRVATDDSWTRPQLARLHAHLAMRYAQTDPAASGTHALTAVNLDPASPMRLQAARRLVAIGAPDRARAMIQQAPAGSLQGYQLREAAEILVKLHDPDGALALLRPEKKDVAGDPLVVDATMSFLLVDALREAGRIDEARALLAKVIAPSGKAPFPMTLRRAHERAFQIERDHGTPAALGAAYDELRDDGFSVDPFGRLRLSVFRRAPGLPWRARDAEGLALFVLVLIGCAVLPVVVIAPVHYRGLARRVADKSVTATDMGGDGWQLRHAWYALAALITMSAVAEYLHAYPTLLALFAGEGTSDEKHLARMLITTELLTALALLPLWFRTPFWQVIRGRWSILASAGAAVACAIFLRVAAWGCGQVVTSLFAATDVLGAETTRALTGIYVHYGRLPLVLVAAVMVPVVEETVFRGVLLSALSKHVHFRSAALVQALLFAIIHEDRTLFVFFILFGCVLAWLRKKSGGLLAPILTHALFNVVAALSIAWLSKLTNG